MVYFIVLVVYLLLDKVIDNLYGVFQIKTQAELQKAQKPVVEAEEDDEQRQIGFVNYGDTTIDVGEDDE